MNFTMASKGLVLFYFLILLGGLVSAQEDEPVYNFGSMQSSKYIFVEPGEKTVTKLYFFNIHGNRVTHIKLFAQEVPDGWEVEFKPVRHIEMFNVSGVIVNSSENLFVSPTQPVPKRPESKEDGLKYIPMDNVDGLVPAKVVEVTINAPGDAPLGKEYKIKVEALANWFGQTGMVSFSQSRNFEYIVKTASNVYYEELAKKEVEDDLEGDLPENMSMNSNPDYQSGQKITWNYIAICLLLMVVVIQFILMKRKKV